MSVIREAEQQEVHLRDYLKVIRKRRYAVVVFFLLVVSLVTLATFTATSVYRANALLLIEKAELYSFNEMGFSTYDPEFYSTQYELIRSQPVSRRVVDTLADNDIFRSYFDFGKRNNTLKNRVKIFIRGVFGMPIPAVLDEEAWRDAVAVELGGSIQVVPIRDTRIVQIGYYSTKPELAALVVNNVATAYIDALLDLRMSATQHSLSWMTEKVEEERKALERAEQKLQGYMQQYDIVTLEDRLAILPQKLSELSTQLTRAETHRKELETLYLKIQSILPDLRQAESLPVIAADATVASLRTQILKAEQQLSELSKRFGEKHPTMIEAREDLKGLQEKKKQEIMRVVQSVRNEYDIALSNENNVRRSLSDTKNDILNVNEKFIQYGVLKRDVETNRQLFESLLKRMREQSINEEVQTVNVMFIEQAKPPRVPEKPNKLMNMIAGLLVGLFGGLLMAFFVEYFDNTVKSPEDAEARIGIPVLGMISQLKGLKKNDGRQIERIVLDEPKSTFAESYKALRTSLMLSSADAPPKTVLITSMGPEEGKTSTSVNLALAIAQSDMRVLLIDSDLRKPRIHSVFSLTNRVGLSTWLAGNSAKIIKEGPVPNLNIITSGPIPPNPSELLASSRFRKLVEGMQQKYDVIIFDSPPLMSVTDSMIISRIVDGTVVVAKAGRTSYDVIRKGVRQLNDMNANILGLLINAIDVSRGGYYYHYYQNYHYYHAYGSEETEEEE